MSREEEERFRNEKRKDAFSIQQIVSHTKCGSAYLKVQTGCCERIRDSIILDEWRNLRTVSMVLRKGEERNKRLYSTCHTHTYTYAHKSPDFVLHTQ